MTEEDGQGDGASREAGPYRPLEHGQDDASARRTCLRKRVTCVGIVGAVLAGAFACYSLLCTLPSRPTLVRTDGAPAAETGSEGAEEEDSLFVVAIGDWGGIPLWPFVTPAQIAVRNSMAAAVKRSRAPVKRILAVGDNFYGAGVQSVDDSRFKATFEDVYITGYPELAEPDMWRVVAGNHDYQGNVSAQIAFTSRSPAWHFPSEYYSFVEKLPGGTRVEFVMTDTVLLSAGTRDGLPGETEARRGEAHWAWLNDTLAASTAHYLVVAGHYPVWSVGGHGPNDRLVQRLRPLLAQHAVSAYFYGHDHCAQAFRDGNVDHHGVGGAHLVSYGMPHIHSVPKDTFAFHYGGNVWPHNIFRGTFATATFRPNALTATHYDSDGRPLATMMRPPRSAARQALPA